MAFYRNRIYPYLVSVLGNPKPIDDIRRQIVPLAHGTVLELGVGPGVNFRHYDASKVSKLFALEPNPGMRRRASEQFPENNLDVEFLDLPGERIPLEDAAIDTVVSSFTMCTIPGIQTALRGVRRVLKPGGQLIFFEHGLSPDAEIQRWQRRIEPYFRFVFEGCHTTRHIPSLLRDAGFAIEQLNEGYLADFPKAATYCFWGMAQANGVS